MKLRTKAAVTALTALAVLLTAGTASAKSRLDGQLKITNDRMAPLNIRIDGVARGTIPAQSTRTLFHVPNGIRIVKLTGPRGHKTVREVSVPPRKATFMRVAPIFGRAKLVNRTGLTIKVNLDGRYFATLADGQKMKTGPMRAGNYRLTAVPVGKRYNAPTMQRNLKIVPGAPNRIRFDRYLSTLKVTNPYQRGARLFIDGRNMGRVRAGQTLVFGDMMPGNHSIAFKRRGRLLSNNTITLGMGTARSFAPKVARFGSLRVTNHFHRRAKIVIGGQQLGTLAPGETRLFTNLPAGRLEGFAKVKRGGKHYFSTQVRGNDVARVAIGHGAKTRPVPVRPASW